MDSISIDDRIEYVNPSQCNSKDVYKKREKYKTQKKKNRIKKILPDNNDDGLGQIVGHGNTHQMVQQGEQGDIRQLKQKVVPKEYMGSRKQNFVEMIQDETSEQVVRQERCPRDNEIITEDTSPKKKRKKRKLQAVGSNF